MTAIIGPSGTGKSTLIRCINRLVDPTVGRDPVPRPGSRASCSGRELRAARRRIGMVFQEYNLVERLSVIENVLCGRLGYVPVWRAWLRKFPAADIDRAFQLLDAVGLGDFATQRADQLSGGQRQRVGIARALMQEPDLMLADEPTSSLDPKTSVEIMELIARRAGERDIPVIVNIHNVELARRFADRIIGMSKGEIVFDGPPRGARGLAPARRSTAAKDGWSERIATLRRTPRVAFPPNWPARIGLLALALYVVYAAPILDITWARFVAGLGHGARFLSRMFPPNVAPDKLELLYGGMIESLQIAIIATVVGVLLSLPLGLAAARNLAPAPLAWTARALDRAVPHLPSGHRRHPVRQGGRLRRARRHAGADRRLARIPLQAGRRSGRGNVDEAGRGGARDRRAVPLAS